MFAKRMNATTISLPASHVSYVSHPQEIAKFILEAAKGKTTQLCRVDLQSAAGLT